MTAKPKRKSNGGLRPVQFEIHCTPGAVVFLAGTFNHWAPAEKAMADAAGDGHFVATCRLAPGTYEYKFVVNGEWYADAANPSFVVNDCGTLNSVLQVS